MTSIKSLINIKSTINASGTLTLLGGNRLSSSVYFAMLEASQSFFDMRELQQKAGRYLANLVGAEDAYICSGSGAGIVLAISALRCGNNFQEAGKLPKGNGLRNEIIVQSAHENPYMEMIETAAGAEIVRIGTPEKTEEKDLLNAINDRTAGVFYFSFDPQDGVLELEKVINIAHSKGVPVMVDAAGETFPPETILNFIRSKADGVIFSLGKDIGAPNDTGVIFGSKALTEFCRNVSRQSDPVEGKFFIGRSLKTSKEDIFASVQAFKDYMEYDPMQRIREIEELSNELIQTVSKKTAKIKARLVYPDVQGEEHLKHYRPVTIPRVEFYDFPNGVTAQSLYQGLESYNPKILAYVVSNKLYVNSQTLNEEEIHIIGYALLDLLEKQ